MSSMKSKRVILMMKVPVPFLFLLSGSIISRTLGARREDLRIVEPVNNSELPYSTIHHWREGGVFTTPEVPISVDLRLEEDSRDYELCYAAVTHTLVPVLVAGSWEYPTVTLHSFEICKPVSGTLSRLPNIQLLRMPATTVSRRGEERSATLLPRLAKDATRKYPNMFSRRTEVIVSAWLRRVGSGGALNTSMEAGGVDRRGARELLRTAVTTVIPATQERARSDFTIIIPVLV